MILGYAINKCEDEEYVSILECCVNQALSDVQPDFVLYQAGVDIYIDDRLGRLQITEDGIRRRDRWVVDRCVSFGIPVPAVGKLFVEEYHLTKSNVIEVSDGSSLALT
jgi:acetoin utilization deacetylase AcuC-like enzyme